MQKEGYAYIIPVNRQVTDIIKTKPSLGFSQAFRDARILGSDVIKASRQKPESLGFP